MLGIFSSAGECIYTHEYHKYHEYHTFGSSSTQTEILRTQFRPILVRTDDFQIMNCIRHVPDTP